MKRVSPAPLAIDRYSKREGKASRVISLCITASALVLLFAPALVFANGSKNKKVIYYGWGLPDTQYVRDHWREMEEMPFDGLGILVAINRKAWQQGVKGDSNQLGRQITGQREFHIEEFRETIDDLKSAHWRSFTDSFLPVAVSLEAYTRDLNWFDDSRWRIIANNFGVLSRIAAEARLKGLILDPEHYGYRLFSYPLQRRQLDRPFEEYVKIARLRGQQVMRAIANQIPAPVLLSFYGHSLLLREIKGKITLREAEYGLMPGFYDGLLDAMPKHGRLIDGYEFSYGFKDKQQFVDGYNKVNRSAVRFSATPKYRKNVQAGFGLWIDRDQEGTHFTPAEFRTALGYALEASDKYVWIYGQNVRLFPPSGIPGSFIESIATARRSAEGRMPKINFRPAKTTSVQN